MALALYRKYRPRTFAEVIGQEHVTEPLSQALRSGRLHHAYLFSGPRGCGKTSSARILARSLNCERGPTPEPCGVCDSCRALAPDGSGSIDVIEIDAASHGGVDDARELRERAFFAPASSRFKIYVIDEAHMVSTQGFNALLKLVEEPPDYVKFIFATTEPDKVLGTIKSRTHHYPFRLIPPGILRPYLEQLADAENVKVEQPVFPLVVRAGGGSARDALSVLDQLIAGAGPEGVSYTRALALLGVTDAALIDEMCDALAAGDGAAAYATIDRVAEAGHDPRRFASDLLERLRDLIVMQQVPEAAAKGLIDGPTDQLERMGAQAQRLGPATLSRCADIVHNGLIEMRGTTAPRLLLELVTARMLLPTADRAESDLLQRLERMERRLALTGDQGYAPEEPGDDYSGPAVLSGRAPSPTRQPGGGGGAGVPAPVDGGSAGTPVATGGGAAAARAAAAAAASRAGGGPRRTEIVPDDDAVAGADESSGDVPPDTGVTPLVGDDAHPGGSPARGTDGAAAADRADEPVAATVNGHDEQPRRVPPQAVMADPATPEPVIPEAAAPGALDAAAVRRVWDEIVAMVRHGNKKIAALASEATVRDIDGDTLVLTFRHAFHARTLAENPEPVADAIYEVLGGRWQIRCELAGDERAGGPGPGPAPAPPASGRASGGSSSPAGGRAPGQERGARDRSSSVRGESGASGDRSSDEDHPAARSTLETRPGSDPADATQSDARRHSNAGYQISSTAGSSDAVGSAGGSADGAVAAVGSGRGGADVGQGSAAHAAGNAHRRRDTDGGQGRGDDDRRATDAAVPAEEPRGERPERPVGAGGAAASHGEHVAERTPLSATASSRAEPMPPGRPGEQRGPRDVAGAAAEHADQPRPGAAGPREGQRLGGVDQRAPLRPGDAAQPGRPTGNERASGRPGLDRRPAAAASTVATDEEEDWPETAQPGGLLADGESSGEDRPETAAPAFSVAQASPNHAAPPAAVAVAAPVAVAAAPSSQPAPARAAPPAGGGGAAAAARAAARAAAAGRTKAAAPLVAAQGKAADSDWAGEPPFDPDYDTPGKARFVGFDPGDEPTDEVIDEKTARQSSEQQAFALLHEALGAERIGEIDLK